MTVKLPKPPESTAADYKKLADAFLALKAEYEELENEWGDQYDAAMGGDLAVAVLIWQMTPEAVKRARDVVSKTEDEAERAVALALIDKYAERATP
jgi:hypothetical protein